MPSSGRRGPARRVRPLLAALVAGALAVSAVPPATAAEPTSTTTITADSLRATAQNDPNSDVGRFVTLWDTRFRSGPAFQAYLDSDEQYDDGYNDRRPEEQEMLVRALVDHWRTTDPAFRDHVDWEPRDPEGEPERESKEGERPHVEQVMALVTSIVFHKESFKKSLREHEERAEEGSETPSAEAPQGPTPVDPLTEAAATELSDVVRRAREVAAIDHLDARAEQVLAPVAGQVRDAVPPDVLDRIPTTGDVVGLDLGEIGTTLGRLQKVLPDAELADVERPRDITVPARYTAAALEPDDLLYGVCWAVGSGAQTCTGRTYVVGIGTQVPGLAAEIDVDGNLTTGLAGIDLEIGLVIDPLAAPGGLGAAVTVKKYSNGLTDAAKFAKGVVYYRLPGSTMDVFVGFDGRTVTLQPQQAVSALFENVLAMSANDMRIRASVTHTGTPGVPTVRLVTDVADSASTDGLAATTSFVRAPATHTTRLVMRRSNQTSIVRVESGHSGPGLPDLQLDAAARFGAARLVGGVRLTNVPATTTVDVTSDHAVRKSTATYTSSSQLTRLQAGVEFVADAVNAPGTKVTAALDVHRLPTNVTLVVDDLGATYNANAGISATTGNALEATVEERLNGTVRRRAFFGLTSAPTSVQISRAGAPVFVLDSGAGIAGIEAAYVDTSLLLDASVKVTGFPGHAELRLPWANDPKVSWVASAPTTKVVATAKYGVWQGGLTVTNVPASISVVPRTTEIDVNATGGSPASLTAYVTNTGQYVVSPTPGDNYATATYKKNLVAWPWFGGGSANVAAITAALHVQGIQRVRVTPGAATTFELKLGGGAPLYVMGRFEDGLARKYAEARLVNFPGHVHGTIGTTTEIWSSANAELRAYVESGPIGTYPAMASPHGAVFHRTGTPWGQQHRGTLYLTGLPTYVKVAPGSVTLNGLRPTVPTLTVEVKLLDNSAAPTEAYAWLSGIPVNVTHNVTLTWSTQQLGNVVTTKVKGQTSGATFGALSVSLRYAQYAATLDTTSLPSLMEATITESEGATTFGWNASAVISALNAGLLARPNAGSPFSGRGSVALSNIPSWFTLTVGRGAAGTGPVMAYDSNTSATLSATVVADGSLKTSSSSLHASLFFRLTSLARKVDVTPLGAGFKLASTGRTSRVEAKVSASATLSTSGGNTVNLGWVRLPWNYELGLSGFVKDLTVDLSQVAGLEVALGLVSRISGDYGSFLFRYDSFVVNVRASLVVRFEVNLGFGWYGFDVFRHNLQTSFSVNPSLRIYETGWQDLVNRTFNIPCREVKLIARVQPRAVGTTNFQSGLSLVGGIGWWRTYYVTPVMLNWTWLSDIVTGLVLHGTGFVSVSVPVRKTCWI